jgi:hypothetical protein
MSDDLLKQIDDFNAKQAAVDAALKKQNQQSSSARTVKELSALVKFWYQILRSLEWIWTYVGSPLWSFSRKVTLYLFRRYRDLWDYVVYKKDEYGDKQFNKTRGGLMLLATGLTIWYLGLPLIEFAKDSSLYLMLGRRHETIIMHNAQEIDKDTDTWSVQGCESIPCGYHSSVNFRVRTSLFNHLWAFIHTGNVFFPDAIGAAIPPVPNKCDITSYGIRWKFLMRGMDLYPDLLDVERCTPVSIDIGLSPEQKEADKLGLTHGQ